MRKRAMLPLLALMMVPTLGSAATYWQITATTSPTALKTNLTAARPANFGNYTTPGGASMSLTKVTATPYNTVDFVVAPVPGKAVIVKVDGVQVGTAPGTYSVNKGTLLNHNIIAYYNTAAASYTLTTQPAAGGSITQSATYATNGTVTVTPASGYVVSGLIIGSTTYSLADSLPAGVSLTGGAAGATYTFASGSYTVKGVFAAAPAAKAIISSSGMTVAIGATGIIIDGSTSTSNVAGTTYGWSASCGTIVPTADPKKATYTAPATVGSCTVTLTVNAAGVSPAPTATVNIATQSPAVVSTQLCLDCHNGTDGPVVPGTFATNAHNGQASCVDCHNNGNTASHPYNTAAVMANSCTPCHNNVASAESVAWKGGAHGAATGHTTGTCQRCHASEGAVTGATVGWTGSYATLIANQATVWTPLTSAVPPLASENGISCAVCHDPHTGTGLRAINTVAGGNVVPWDPNQNSQSNDQYDVCTSCHSLTDNTGALVGNYHDGGSINTARTISDSHFDNSATGVGLATNVVEGYVVRGASDSACADCHNVHSADLSVQEGWAKSAHAGKIATKKEEALCSASLAAWNTANPSNTATSCEQIKASGRTIVENYKRSTAGIATAKAAGALDDADGNAWTHYNWDQTSSRGACQRCHTSTGIMNFLNNPATYDAAGTGNNFSHLSGWTAATGSPQQELLYCWGCHSDSQTGELRNPGAITEVYAAATAGAPVATVVYPDLGKSNVCMGCHLGREIGQNVANDTDADGVRSFINSHYLAAGATIFNQSGYEYAGQSYNDLGYHKNVGVANAHNTGTNGPCVTCHMTSAEGHSFEVSAASSSCVNCHGNLTTAALEASKHEFHLALEELNIALKAKGIEFKPAHPYFYQIGTNTAFTNWAGVYGLASWKDVMGAAFNYNLLDHDPGAYAHNRQYALKLIQDSIDFLADGVVDGLGVSAAFTAAAANKEFAEATSHTAQAVATPDATSCATCHAAAPHFGGTALVKAQYVAPATSVAPAGGSCADCHSDGTGAVAGTINKQYAESAHGNPDGEAWWHYDWRSSSRAACARCHNGTAYVAKLGIESNTTNIFTAADANKAGEVLSCNACHTDVATGAVRTPGAYTETYADGTGVTLAFPNVGKSNLCMRCHSGRESGGTIAADTDADGNRSFINSHYLTAGGTIFTTTGYEFAGQSYANVPYYAHDKVGIADPLNPAATDAGPCASCHMGNGTANHTWEVVAKDATGLITGITSNSCGSCHAGAYELTPAKLNEEVEGFHAALEALEVALEAKGIFFQARSPYFFVSADPAAVAFVNWNTVATGLGLPAVPGYKDVMGAAFNYNLLHHDPGAYAHNRVYTKRLIFDSIDFIQNGVLDGTLDLSAAPVAAHYLGAAVGSENAVVRP